MDNRITLPKRSNNRKPVTLPPSRQITIIGANGSGKTRFMNTLAELCGNRAYMLSALNSFFPSQFDTPPRPRPGSIEELYTEKIPASQRDSRLPEIDKLLQILLSDEFRYLLTVKADSLLSGKPLKLSATKLDTLATLWHEIFPGNRIISESGKMMFTTGSGENLISTGRLSSGEKAVLYYIAATLYAMPSAVIFIDSPSMFLHPSLLNNLWNAIEGLRPDCTFVYATNDVEFVNSRTENICVWVKSHNITAGEWDYEVYGTDDIPDELFVGIIGTRRPVLFIEGDATHSIDSKLYPLVFTDYTVRPLGSCNKVIEATRSFNDLRPIHQLDSHGIVDRDRRTDPEVDYLRRKNIMVPDVAEVENIFLLEDVVRIMAKKRGKDPDTVAEKVKRAVIKMFAKQSDAQALMHVRHRMKRELECRADARVRSVEELQLHLCKLVDEINLSRQYSNLSRQFALYSHNADYASILKVFNHKPMLPESNVAILLDYPNKDAYISGVLSLLKEQGEEASKLRAAIKRCFGITQ